MTVIEKMINETVKDNGVFIRFRLRYPYIEDGGKYGEKINLFISGIIEKIKSKTKNNCNFFELKYVIKQKEPLSIFFELEEKGGGVFSYFPFALNFTNGGKAAKAAITKNQKKAAARFFSNNGIKLKPDIYTSYYNKDGNTVLFVPDTSKRRSRSVIEFDITSF